MLKVFVRHIDQPTSPLDLEGDIVVAKLSGQPWGTAEVDRVYDWDDATLEAELISTNVNCIVFPYEVLEEFDEPSDPSGKRQERVCSSVTYRDPATGNKATRAYASLGGTELSHRS